MIFLKETLRLLMPLRVSSQEFGSHTGYQNLEKQFFLSHPS